VWAGHCTGTDILGETFLKMHSVSCTNFDSGDAAQPFEFDLALKEERSHG
jgi:hypothetical protein